MLLLLQDIQNSRNGENDLNKFKVCMIYDRIDQEFADWMVKKLESWNLTVFDPNRSRIGFMQNAQKPEIIRNRCQNVILICSTEVFDNPKTEEIIYGITGVKIIPVFYKKGNISNMPEKIKGLTKARYENVRNGFTDKNFLDRIAEGLTLGRVLNQVEKSLDFQ